MQWKTISSLWQEVIESTDYVIDLGTFLNQVVVVINPPFKGFISEVSKNKSDLLADYNYYDKNFGYSFPQN